VRFATLLVTLIVALLLTGFISRDFAGVPSLQLLFSAVFVAGVYAISGRRDVLIIGMAIALVAILTTWWRQLSAQPSVALVIADYAVDVIFFGYVALVITRAVLGETRVTADTVYGGISVYLLLGLIWAVFYSAIECFAPGSFLLGDVSVSQLAGDGRPPSRPRELIYFSFVTLTTLGYGDVRPTTDAARIVSTAEAVVGLLFVAVFIARLVALQLVHAPRDDD
jgi:MFS superfamily sulfate permease-like transporter